MLACVVLGGVVFSWSKYLCEHLIFIPTELARTVVNLDNTCIFHKTKFLPHLLYVRVIWSFSNPEGR